MSESIGFDPADDAGWDILQARADRFADARRAGPVGSWEPYLDDLGRKLRAAVLRELVKVDLEFSWKTNCGRRLEEYASRYPELGSPHQIPRDLIQAEYRYRHLYGDRPGIDEYRGRFPGRHTQLDQLSLPSGRSGGTVGIPPPSEIHDPRPNNSPAVSPEHRFPSGYRYAELLGGGAFGKVWKALTDDGRPVAVKVTNELTPEQAKYADRELAAAGIRHDYLAHQYGAWIHGRRLYLVMELADRNLSDRLADCEATGEVGIPRFELLGYLEGVARALDYLHDRNWIHRDIKPANLLLVGRRAKVADFGLARVLESPAQAASFAGTLGYMAPEILYNRLSRHSDQYSLAVTYLHLRTGRGPRIGHPHLLAGLGHAERQVVSVALADEPDDRHPSCDAFVGLLNDAVRIDAEPARTRRVMERMRREAGNRRHRTVGTR